MSARLRLTTPDTVKSGARRMVSSWPSRDFTLRVWPSSFSTVPRTKVLVPSGGFCAAAGRASRATNAPMNRNFDNIAAPPGNLFVASCRFVPRSGAARVRARFTLWLPAVTLWRQLEADRALDLQGLPNRWTSHHPIVMGGEARVLRGSGFQRVDKAPKEPEEVDVGDRKAAHDPLPTRQFPLGEPEHLAPALDPDPARRVDRRGYKRHPGNRLRLGLKIALGPEALFGIAFR